MSRLWIAHTADNKENRHGAGEEAEATIYYGSAKDSKLACCVRVIWKKGDKRPEIYLTKGLGMQVDFVPR